MNAFRVALRDELTEQQRTYVVAYNYERLTMEEIADRLSVNKSKQQGYEAPGACAALCQPSLFG